VDNITLIASEKNWIDTRSVDALKNVAKLEGVKRVVGLPDLSVGNVPNGMAVITQDYISSSYRWRYRVWYDAL